VLSSATLPGGQVTLLGKLNSRPRKTFTIQFFSGPAADPSGFGEGKTFLGEIQVKTNRKGNGSFGTTFCPLQPVSPGEKIAVTVTDNLTGDTSEFLCVQNGGLGFVRSTEGLPAGRPSPSTPAAPSPPRDRLFWPCGRPVGRIRGSSITLIG
jgi:hypothetical protein